MVILYTLLPLLLLVLLLLLFALPRTRISCRYIFLSRLPEASNVELHAIVPTLDSWPCRSRTTRHVVQSHICILPLFAPTEIKLPARSFSVSSSSVNDMIAEVGIVLFTWCGPRYRRYGVVRSQVAKFSHLNMTVRIQWTRNVICIMRRVTLEVQADHRYTLEPSATERILACDQSTRLR